MTVLYGLGGRNNSGQLGDGTTIDRWTPVQVSGLCSVLTDITENNFPMGRINIYPNLIFNSTTISFSLSQSEKVSLKIFDVNGRLVSTLTDKIFEEGKNELLWSAEDVNAGIYFLQFKSAENLQTEKLIVTK